MVSFWMGMRVISFDGKVPSALRGGRGVIVLSPIEQYGIAMGDATVIDRVLSELNRAA